jgi:hypothetical protein
LQATSFSIPWSAPGETSCAAKAGKLACKFAIDKAALIPSPTTSRCKLQSYCRRISAHQNNARELRWLVAMCPPLPALSPGGFSWVRALPDFSGLIQLLSRFVYCQHVTGTVIGQRLLAGQIESLDLRFPSLATRTTKPCSPRPAVAPSARNGPGTTRFCFRQCARNPYALTGFVTVRKSKLSSNFTSSLSNRQGRNRC